MLLRLINGAGWRKVDSGLKMWIEPIVLASGKLVLQKISLSLISLNYARAS